MLIYDLGWAATSTVQFIWWYSLKAACTLAASDIDIAAQKARAETKRLRESGDAMDLRTWKLEIEEPVLGLVEGTLPALSEGWGNSVGFVGVGLVWVAVAQIALYLYPQVALDGGAWSYLAALPALELFDRLTLIFQIFAIAMPALLAVDPASASSQCSRLEDEINHISGRDSSFLQATNFVKYLKRLNKDQGLGTYYTYAD